MTNLDPTFANRPIPKTKRAPANSIKNWLRLAILQAAGRKFKRSANTNWNKQDKILLIRPDHLGDLIYLTPAIRYLKDLLPESHVTLMAGQWGKSAVENNPHLDQILRCEFPGFTRRPKPSLRQPYQYLRRQAKLLRQRQFDQALILRFDHWWGAWLAAAAGIPRRFGFNVPAVKPFLTDSIPYRDQRHEVEQNWRLVHFAWSRGNLPVVEWWSEPDIIGPTEFFPNAEDKTWSNEWLQQHNIVTDRPLVIIHPGAGAAVKLWRNEAWAELAQSLIECRNCQIILSGGPNEGDLCRAIANSVAPAPALAMGETTLAQLAALMTRANLVIGPDTGPLKLAASVKTPTLQLYGPVDALKFGPWGNAEKHCHLTSGLSCIPCNHLNYKANELAAHYCVQGLSVAKVLATADRLLAAKQEFRA